MIICYLNCQAMHNFFKENMKFLVTDTVDGPDTSSKCIRVRLNSSVNAGRGKNSRKRKERNEKSYDSRGSKNWPENLGKFIKYVFCRRVVTVFLH